MHDPSIEPNDQNAAPEHIARSREQAGTPVEAVLFDYGLVLTGPPDPAAWARMLEITGLQEAEFHSAYWALRHAYDRGTHTGEEYWIAAGQYAGVKFDHAQVAALIDADTELWTQVNQPMVDWALRLQAAGTRTGILSNLGDSMMLGVLRKLPWLAGFDHLLWSHALKLAKPESAIYHHAAEGLRTSAAAILFVDDREENIAAGLDAGMQVIRYIDPGSFEETMQERGFGELWRNGRYARERNLL